MGTPEFPLPQGGPGVSPACAAFPSAPRSIWQEGKATTVPRTPRPHLPSSAAHHLSPRRHMARLWEGPHDCVSLLRPGQQGWGRPLSSPSGPLSTRNSCQGAKSLACSASPPNSLWQGDCLQPLELSGSWSRATWTPDPAHWEWKVLSLGKDTSPQAMFP